MKNVFLSLVLGVSLLGCAHSGSNQSAKNVKMDHKKGMAGKKGHGGEMHGSKQCKMSGMHKKGGMMMSAEMHEKMATMHQQMADCLNSAKSKQECMKMMQTHHQKICQAHGQGSCMKGKRMKAKDAKDK